MDRDPDREPGTQVGRDASEELRRLRTGYELYRPEEPEDPREYIERLRTVERLIGESHNRRLSFEETRTIAGHVARAGFHPDARLPVDDRIVGLEWEGRRLTRSDVLPPAVSHYLTHRNEWPEGTSLEEYIESIRRVARDDRSTIFRSRFEGRLQVGIIRPSGELRGREGGEFVLIEYRVDIARWATAFQPRDIQRTLRNQATRGDRRDFTWIRSPRDIQNRTRI